MFKITQELLFSKVYYLTIVENGKKYRTFNDGENWEYFSSPEKAWFDVWSFPLTVELRNALQKEIAYREFEKQKREVCRKTEIEKLSEEDRRKRQKEKAQAHKIKIFLFFLFFYTGVNYAN